MSREIDESRQRSRTLQRDSIAVRREGAAQIALVGAPNAGKSSLLQALSHVQIKIGNYAFTTVRPVPALTRLGGVLVQLVEIPGLIEGASQDRGGGRALLGVLRGADAVVYCVDAGGPLEGLHTVRAEVASAGIDLPSIVAATKIDEAPPGALERVRRAVPGETVVPVSAIDDELLEGFREALWRLTGLIRVFPRRDDTTEEEPFALLPGSTVVDVAAAIHRDLAVSCRGARVWGPSARFPGQQVGRTHEVRDGDTVEVLVSPGISPRP